MFSMRYLVNLVDSYADETDTVESTRLETNINLEVGAFKDENDQLAGEFVIDDPAIRKAIKHYTHESSINDELIRAEGDVSRLPEDSQIEYKQLISLKGVPMAEGHHTYCGTGTFNPMEVTQGGIFQTPAFLSTSLSLKVAVKTTNYRRDHDHAVEDHVIHFILPEGFAGGFYVAPYSNDPEELEYLVFPQENFRHVGSQVLPLDGVKRHVHSFKPS
jgi:hypothetical protein